MRQELDHITFGSAIKSPATLWKRLELQAPSGIGLAVVRTDQEKALSKEEFERYAQHFMRMANDTTDLYIREQLIEIARVWMNMARDEGAKDRSESEVKA